ncbi:DNA alkylation repair protein [Rhizobium sp. L1K21]|uniref:DNA alkylation repair protein n=1 Tax=Rhizobium sp. L1K21 TaxID=2954933 RepID=UPI002093C833|nr:DNA alkylation repair protein [Rhizobium sp. L1K21]MCO6185736.1 DNA alkylation repair protein [Rhizobium sp. L1K21]
MEELTRRSTAAEIIAHLKTLSDADNIAGMTRYGIVTDTALGISNTELRKIARKVGKDHARAHELWDSNIREARLLAAFTAEPKTLTADDAMQWAQSFNSWEIVDGFADLFMEARLEATIPQFAADEREFVRRTAFAMMAWGAVHFKKEPDERILSWLPIIETYASDSRNFVKKAVNWALRNIGKRSRACHAEALKCAEKLAASTDKTERWIGRDAVRELTSEKTIARIKN